MTIESFMVINEGLDFRKSNTMEPNIKEFEDFEVHKFTLPSNSKHHILTQAMENRNARPSWGIDAMLIDEEMLYLDEVEADRVYQDLKAKSDRRRQMEHRQNRLSSQMSLDEETLKKLGSLNNESESMKSFSVRDEDFKSNKSSKEKKEQDKKEAKKAKEAAKAAKKEKKSEKASEIKKKESQSCEKIKQFIKKSNEQERLEFTQGIINFAHKIDRKFLIEGLLPNLEILTKEKLPDTKMALIDQFIPIINYIGDQCGQDGYQEACLAVFPLLDGLLYDPNELIRDKAIQILTDLRYVVQQKENDYIMNITLKLAHDDLDMNRISSLKIMNELAPDMG